MATAAVVTSFTLAAFDKQTASDVATTVFTACVTYLVTYAVKSLGEKVSRNRHGLDENGLPYVPEQTNLGEEDTFGEGDITASSGFAEEMPPADSGM
jgi:hypothetical protein